ncbi:putative Ca2+/H+ antiporter (TMEM165/GDT1 family) [Marmoricola sp. OAE513]|uniref:TMEM165/GDT1 family protein n=1 Tax=Marmoricola sp. OAE513 TaxID=2817894 RepID=UPI001AE89B01
MDIAVVALSFAAIFVVELPDKTFIAALVLSTRYPGRFVWIGVGLAFLIQTLIAVSVGRVITFLPDTAVKVVAAVIFLAGAILLFREAPKADAEEAGTEDEFAAKADARAAKTGLAAIGASFIVLFAAEWGDLSQLLTISLVSKYDEPVSVFLGAWLALLAVSGLAVLAGRFLLQRIRLSLVYYLGGGICLILEALTIYEIAFS